MKKFSEIYTEAMSLDAVNKDRGNYDVTVFMGRMRFCNFLR